MIELNPAPGGGYQYEFPRPHWTPTVAENTLIPVEQGLAKLDYEYSNEYGGADCHPFIAWTVSKVYFMGEYDGATGLNWLPRNPVDIEPQFSGQ